MARRAIRTAATVLVLSVAAITGTANPFAAATTLPRVRMAAATAAQPEGDSGTAPLTLTVTLSAASTSTVTVHYTTLDSVATAADNDYVATAGTVTFVPGDTSQPITIPIAGDTKLEDYETFSVKLSAPTNATLGTASTIVTILNDDTPTLTMASIAHVAGGDAATFMPHLVQRYYQDITLHASTTDGTAKAPANYTAVNEDVVFPAGSKTAVPTSVNTTADPLPAPTRKFNLTIAGAGVVSAVTRSATIDANTCVGATAPATYQHVILVVMENHTYSSVIGNAAAPFQTALARGCASDNHYASAGSPSRPSYIAMVSGDTYGCQGSDADPPGNCTPPGPTLFGQVLASGGTALTYAENMTTNCQRVSSGLYAVKHNPWAYFQGEATQCQLYDQPMPATIDVDNLPTFLYLVPNLCNDSHNCSVATGDQWLQSHLAPILASPAYQSGSTAVIVTYDEYTNLPNMFASRSVRPGTLVTTNTSHYGLLRTVEDMLGLSPLGNAATATSLRTPMHL